MQHVPAYAFTVIGVHIVDVVRVGDIVEDFVLTKQEEKVIMLESEVVIATPFVTVLKAIDKVTVVQLNRPIDKRNEGLTVSQSEAGNRAIILTVVDKSGVGNSKGD